MKIRDLLIVLLIATQAQALSPRPKSYRPGAPSGEQPTTAETNPRIQRALDEGKPAQHSRDLGSDLGVDPKTGIESNDTQSSFKFQIDSFAAYVFKIDTVKLGLSPVLIRTEDGLFALNADIADNLVGLSGNVTVPYAHVVRLRVGVGFGRMLGEDARFLDSKGSSRNVAYLKGSIRLW